MAVYASSQPQDIVLIRKFARIPLLFFVVSTLIVLFGCTILYSAAKGSMDPWALRQLVRFLVGVPMMLMVAVIDIRVWHKLAYPMYLFGIFSLIATAALGVEGGLGAQRWLNIGGFQFQPSEFMKIFLVMAIARYYHGLHPNDVRKFWTMLPPLMLIGVAGLLILKQPNLGTAAIVCALGALMLFLGGVNWKYFLVGAVLAAAALPVLWNYALHDYQKQRVYTFLDPESDPLGTGYNIIQSKIAIGSGGFWGKGFLNGTQSQLAFIPERQTDFIFSIMAEEFGFVGGVGILLAYTVLIFSMMMIAIRSQHTFGRLVAIGMAVVMFLHVLINVGMVMGLLPVVGVPLPLLSYGGSSLLAMQVGFGFVMNMHVHHDAKMRSANAYGD